MTNQICDGNGASITFATSAFVGVYNQIGGLRRFIDAIDKTSLSDTVSKYCPGKVTKFDPVEVEIQWDPENQPPALGTEETITITLPKGIGQTTAGTMQASGFVADLTTPNWVNGELGVGTMVIQFSTLPAITSGS